MLRRNTNTIVITPQKKELDEIRLQVNSEKNNIQVLSQEIIKLENKKSDLSKEVQKLLDSFLFSQSKIAESEDILKKNKDVIILLNTKIVQKNNELSAINNQITKSQFLLVHSLPKELEQKRKEIEKQFVNQKESYENSLVPLLIKIEDLNKAISKKQTILESYGVSIKEAENKLVEWEKMIESNVKKLDEFHTLIDEKLVELNNVSQKIENISSLELSKKSEIEKLQTEVDALSTERENLKKENNELKVASIPLLNREARLVQREQKVIDLYQKAGITITL